MGREINLKGMGKATQFGMPNGNDNAKGGTKKGKRISTIIKDLLDTNAAAFSDNIDYKNLDTNTALAVELITMAFHKDNSTKDKLNAIKEILDRVDGKPKQSFDFDVSEVKPLITRRFSDINN